MLKKSITLASLLAFSVLVFAHEFWLLPQKWFVEVGEPVQIQVRVGENFAGERWDAGISRVVRLVSILKKKETDWLPVLQKNGLENLQLTFEKSGTQLIALATNNKFIELEAGKFDAYLAEDGLDHIRQLRQKLGQSNRAGREFYRREAALLVQVGERATPVSFQKTGFDLQILPKQNPLLTAGSTVEMDFQIRFRGKPLAGAAVRHWQKVAATGKVEQQTQISDRRGRVRFQLGTGEQMVSLVHMIPHPAAPTEADWQSVWGTLTFCRK